MYQQPKCPLLELERLTAAPGDLRIFYIEHYLSIALPSFYCFLAVFVPRHSGHRPPTSMQSIRGNTHYERTFALEGHRQAGGHPERNGQCFSALDSTKSSSRDYEVVGGDATRTHGESSSLHFTTISQSSLHTIVHTSLQHLLLVNSVRKSVGVSCVRIGENHHGRHRIVLLCFCLVYAFVVYLRGTFIKPM